MLDYYGDFYKEWQSLPVERLRILSERAIRDLSMPEILALRLIFKERYQRELQESHENSIN